MRRKVPQLSFGFGYANVDIGLQFFWKAPKTSEESIWG
ncbi:hypothetical protein APA_1965 [Pseudanabaena sp. lw0831]|nr:hypothetical protein APA_1965 [Pseudanabaena sp. lw0831]